MDVVAVAELGAEEDLDERPPDVDADDLLQVGRVEAFHEDALAAHAVALVQRVPGGQTLARRSERGVCACRDVPGAGGRADCAWGCRGERRLTARVGARIRSA